MHGHLQRRYLGRATRWALPLLLLAGLGIPATAQEMCVACHANRELLSGLAGTAAGDRYVDRDAFSESIHGSLGFACRSCHSDVADYPHEQVRAVECGACHGTAGAQLAASVHGRPHGETGAVPATCADCHTRHHILVPTDPQSTVYRLTQFETCAGCHSDAEKMGAFGQTDVETVTTYLHSVHARGLLQKGLAVAPVCTECHGAEGKGAHGIEVVASPASPVNRDDVADSCGRCHVGILRAYRRGIHGTMFAQGNRDVPTCTDCHGEHAVQPITSPESGVYPTHIAQTCTACHDREDLNERYGLPSARLRTYLGSFHGIALRSGQITVANCESCHGAHEILPSSDSASSIHPANLITTCGRCHPGIGRGVAQGKVHVASVRQDIGILALGVLWFYYVVIGGLVVYAAFMIFLDQYRHRVVDPRRRAADRG